MVKKGQTKPLDFSFFFEIKKTWLALLVCGALVRRAFYAYDAMLRSIPCALKGNTIPSYPSKKKLVLHYSLREKTIPSFYVFHHDNRL
jgi:hypothetical protein